MTEPSQPTGVVRHCLWFKCPNEIVPRVGAGRPEAYCSDECRAKVKAHRKLTREGGGDEALADFIAASAPMLAEAQRQREMWGDVEAAIEHVKEAALAGIAEAEAGAVRAVEHMRTAEDAAHRMAAERDQALRDAAEARKARDTAKQAQTAAERAARGAQADAQRQITQAWRGTAEHERERGKAEATAAEAVRQGELLNKRVEKLVVEARKVRGELDEATQKLAGTEAERSAAQARVEQLAEELHGVKEQLAGVETERATAVAGGVQLQAEVERLAAELEAARQRTGPRRVGRARPASGTRRRGVTAKGQAPARVAGAVDNKNATVKAAGA